MTYNLLKERLIETIVKEVPRQFWVDFQNIARHTYLECYQRIDNDTKVLSTQKSSALHQDRFFKMECVLKELAEKYGWVSSETICQTNRFNHYVYAATKSLGITQTYVQTISAMPNPAKYIKDLASIANIPRLDLGDEPDEVRTIKSFYGLITHNPVGKNFSEDQQKLATIQLCVPSKDAKKWAVELMLAEIISCYAKEEVSSVTPKLKLVEVLPVKKKSS